MIRVLASIVPPSQSAASLINLLQALLQSQSIKASECIPKHTQSPPPSPPPNLLDHGLQVNLYVHTNTVWWNGWARRQRALLSTPHHTSHRDWRAFMRKYSSGSRSIGSGLEDIQEFPAVKNHTNCVDLWMLCKSGWDEQLRKIELVFHIMGWCLSTQGSAKYIIPVPQSTSVIPESPYTPCLLPPNKLNGGDASAKCNSVRKTYTHLPDTPVALTSASEYFQMLPAPPGALQSSPRLCKSILTGFWKHL